MHSVQASRARHNIFAKTDHDKEYLKAHVSPPKPQQQNQESSDKLSLPDINLNVRKKLAATDLSVKFSNKSKVLTIASTLDKLDSFQDHAQSVFDVGDDEFFEDDTYIPSARSDTSQHSQRLENFKRSLTDSFKPNATTTDDGHGHDDDNWDDFDHHLEQLENASQFSDAVEEDVSITTNKHDAKLYTSPLDAHRQFMKESRSKGNLSMIKTISSQKVIPSRQALLDSKKAVLSMKFANSSKQSSKKVSNKSNNNGDDASVMSEGSLQQQPSSPSFMFISSLTKSFRTNTIFETDEEEAEQDGDNHDHTNNFTTNNNTVMTTKAMSYKAPLDKATAPVIPLKLKMKSFSRFNPDTANNPQMMIRAMDSTKQREIQMEQAHDLDDTATEEQIDEKHSQQPQQSLYHVPKLSELTGNKGMGMARFLDEQIRKWTFVAAPPKEAPPPPDEPEQLNLRTVFGDDLLMKADVDRTPVSDEDYQMLLFFAQEKKQQELLSLHRTALQNNAPASVIESLELDYQLRQSTVSGVGEVGDVSGRLHSLRNPSLRSVSSAPSLLLLPALQAQSHSPDYHHFDPHLPSANFTRRAGPGASADGHVLPPLNLAPIQEQHHLHLENGEWSGAGDSSISSSSQLSRSNSQSDQSPVQQQQKQSLPPVKNARTNGGTNSLVKSALINSNSKSSTDANKKTPKLSLYTKALTRKTQALLSTLLGGHKREEEKRKQQLEEQLKRQLEEKRRQRKEAMMYHEHVADNIFDDSLHDLPQPLQDNPRAFAFDHSTTSFTPVGYVNHTAYGVVERHPTEIPTNHYYDPEHKIAIEDVDTSYFSDRHIQSMIDDTAGISEAVIYLPPDHKEFNEQTQHLLLANHANHSNSNYNNYNNQQQGYEGQGQGLMAKKQSLDSQSFASASRIIKLHKSSRDIIDSHSIEHDGTNLMTPGTVLSQTDFTKVRKFASSPDIKQPHVMHYLHPNDLNLRSSQSKADDIASLAMSFDIQEVEEQGEDDDRSVVTKDTFMQTTANPSPEIPHSSVKKPKAMASDLQMDILKFMNKTKSSLAEEYRDYLHSQVGVEVPHQAPSHATNGNPNAAGYALNQSRQSLHVGEHGMYDSHHMMGGDDDESQMSNSVVSPEHQHLVKLWDQLRKRYAVDKEGSLEMKAKITQYIHEGIKEETQIMRSYMEDMDGW